MGQAGPGGVTVVVERLRTAAGDDAIDVAGRLARRGLQVDVAALGPHPAFPSARPRRGLVTRRGVRVRDLLAEAARPPGTAGGPERARSSHGGRPWLDPMNYRPAVVVPPSLAHRDLPDEVAPIRVLEEISEGRDARVRVRMGPQGRAYQYEHLDAAGRAAVVAWLDLDSGATTAILLFDHLTGTVSRFSPVRAAARLLGPGTRVVVAVDAFGDKVGNAPGVSWTVVPSGADVVKRALAAAEDAA